MEEIDRQECLALLAGERLGRLGVLVDGVPLVLPMQFALDGEDIVLRTNAGAKFNEAPLSAVSFEVDHVDWEKKEGWSVLVKGVAQDISTAIDTLSVRFRSLGLDTWAPQPADAWIRVVPQSITGRRISA
jgi:hypothetical protein